MAAEQAENANGAADKDSERKKNEVSTIVFPYNDLDSAIAIVRTVLVNAGTACTLKQLAGYLDMEASAGGFRARIAPARIFGLADFERGNATLTDLGRQILDEPNEKAARVTAFLNVELYKAVFEKFDGGLLPKGVALEQEMLRMGVAPKQTDKARQVFERSAQQAGFFARGKERLIMPIIGDAPPPKKDEEEKKKKKTGGGGGGDHPDLDPIVQALVAKIPPVDPTAPWAVKDQAKWLQMMAMAFGMIYEADGTITVNVSEAS